MFEVRICSVPGCSRLSVFDVTADGTKMRVAQVTKKQVDPEILDELVRAGRQKFSEDLMVSGVGTPAALQEAFRVLSCARCGGAGHVGGCRACGGITEV
jgi:hypothetical protein